MKYVYYKEFCKIALENAVHNFFSSSKFHLLMSMALKPNWAIEGYNSFQQFETVVVHP